MPLPPSVLLQAPSKALYDAAWAEKQRADQDLIVYCPSFLLGLPCRIAWPTVNGHRVPAIHIREFLIANGLHWSCFCPMSDPATRETSASCRIVTWPDLGTFAVCHHSLPRCQFFIDLVQVYHMSTLRQPYEPVSKTDSSMTRFLLSPEAAPSSIGQSIYLPGYLGEREGGTQLGGIMEGNSDTFLASYCDYIQPNPSALFFFTLALRRPAHLGFLRTLLIGRRKFSPVWPRVLESMRKRRTSWWPPARSAGNTSSTAFLNRTILAAGLVDLVLYIIIALLAESK
ncbi:hypothetical protein DFH06DRAFT_1135268 [Mycena polygramma]|nr:hypothetical protein DFH06DRAFT_1135268 [Mycena polygramma]